MTRFRLELSLKMYADLEANDVQTALETLQLNLEIFLSRKPPAWQFFICPVKDMKLMNVDTLREMDITKWQK